MVTSKLLFTDTMYVENISETNLIGETVIQLSFRDETRNDVPTFKGPSHRVDPAQAIENYVTVVQNDDKASVYEMPVSFDEYGGEFTVTIELNQIETTDAMNRFEVSLDSIWEETYQDIEDYVQCVRMMKQTHEYIIDSIEETVGLYNFEFEGNRAGEDARPGTGSTE